MSRGPGAVQRFVLDELARVRAEDGGRKFFEWTSAPTLARRLAGGRDEWTENKWGGAELRWSGGRAPTAYEAMAIRRAVNRLAARGLVKIGRWWWLDAHHFGEPARVCLWARLVLTPEQRAAEEAESAREEAEWEARREEFVARAVAIVQGR